MGGNPVSELFIPRARQVNRGIRLTCTDQVRNIRGALGLPFLLAGSLKSVCDLGLYLIFSDVRLSDAASQANT